MQKPTRYVQLSLVSLLSVLLSSPLSALELGENFTDPVDGHLDASRYLSEVPFGFLPVPTIITEPAVGTGLGLGAVFFHETDEQKKQRQTSAIETHKAILPSNISFLGLMATDNGSKAGGVGHLGFWHQDRMRYRGFLLYPDINLDYYSLGGFELPSGVELNLAGPVVLQELKFRLSEENHILKNVFAGMRQTYRKVDLSLADADSFAPFESDELNALLQDYLDIHANRELVTSGVGAVLEYDNRNSLFNPEQGYYFSGRYEWYDDGLGSDANFYASNLTALGWLPLSQQFILGLRFQYDSVAAQAGSSLPPYVLPYVNLRGIPAVRYQNTRVAVAEAQLDWKLSERWKLSLFSGAGHTAEHFDELDSGDSAHTAGTGFRYLIARRYGFVMGADIARGPEETAFYIQAGSTW